MSKQRQSRWKSENRHVYQSAEYRRNRAKVMKRDLGMCQRCWHLKGIMRFDVECDHYRHIKSGETPDNSMGSLWLLCRQCHDIKTAQEANGKASLLKPFGDYDRDADGWSINVDWLGLIADRNRMFGF